MAILKNLTVLGNVRTLQNLWSKNIHADSFIKNGIDLDRYKYDKYKRCKIREKYNLGDSFIMGHVGRFSYQKNQEYRHR